ncbi:MAG: alpha/beta fold hydrolase [Myxococcaceae bacterium]
MARYDRRGHGASETPPPPYTIGDLGADALGLLDALGIERAHFCGLSIGGYYAEFPDDTSAIWSPLRRSTRR